METAVFVISAIVCIGGAIGVVLNPNPVHAALSLVATLFGIAVLFIAQHADFLAVVQVIVYAGAIVVLFLFVIMLLGVDRAENLDVEPLGQGHRIVALVLATVTFMLPVAALASVKVSGHVEATGQPSGLGKIGEDASLNVHQLGEVLFTRDLYAFEITSALLIIAVVGAVLLSRRVLGEGAPIDEDEILNDDPEPLDDADESDPEPAGVDA